MMVLLMMSIRRAIPISLLRDCDLGHSISSYKLFITESLSLFSSFRRCFLFKNYFNCIVCPNLRCEQISFDNSLWFVCTCLCVFPIPVFLLLIVNEHVNGICYAQK